MGSLVLKPGVKIDRLQVGGACILGALVRTVAHLSTDLRITAVTNGRHGGGATGPHARGDGVDVGSKEFSAAAKTSILQLVMGYLAEFTAEVGSDPRLVETSGGLATALFFGQLEDLGSANEHLHFQERKGQMFPPGADRTVRA